MRPGRVVLAPAGALDEGAEMVSAVAMVRPSNGGDSTAAEGMPQRRDDERANEKKRGREGEPGHAFCHKEETFAAPRCGKRVRV